MHVADLPVRINDNFVTMSCKGSLANRVKGPLVHWFAHQTEVDVLEEAAQQSLTTKVFCPRTMTFPRNDPSLNSQVALLVPSLMAAGTLRRGLQSH